MQELEGQRGEGAYFWENTVSATVPVSAMLYESLFNNYNLLQLLWIASCQQFGLVTVESG